MTQIGKNIEERVWDYLYKKIGNACGVAGLMGNLYAESGLIFNRVETLCLKRLKENGKNYTDVSYTAAVDDGSISRAEFLHPLPGRQYGYGLAQWTSPERKAGLYDLAKTKGVSIADEENSLDFLLKELQTSYTSVFSTLKTAASVKQASDIVLKKFECPPDTGRSVQNARAKYGQAYYDKFFKAAGMNNMNSAQASVSQAIDQVIKTAANEIGYLEKATDSRLDSKTANAGNNNFTKYWRDVYPAFQGQPWCACFVSWVFMKAFGQHNAEKLLKHWPYVYCPTLGSLFTRNADPNPGDIVLFYRNGTFAHTGIVTEVSGDQFRTVEGNASGASGITPNGGGVVEKTYLNSQLPGTKFCTPDWSVLTKAPVSASQEKTTPQNTASPLRIDPAQSFSRVLAGAYTTTADLNLRTGAGTDPNRQKIQCVIPKGGTVRCYGYYTTVNHTKWYLVAYQTYTGFVSANYLAR